jgi:heterodisulfide reductase subunit A-like polyferredoxin
MDLQAVNPGNYAEELAARGIRFDRCRPGEISFEGKYPVVAYEDAEGKKQKRFDYLFLNTGIHPDITGNTALADLTGLKVERSGFLGYVSEPLKSGVYLAGCSLFPMGILDTIASARNTAAMLINKEARGSNWEHEGGVQ